MKKKYICMVIASSLMIGSASLVFAGTNVALTTNTLTEAKSTSSAITTSGAAVKTSSTAITTTGTAVTTSNTAITTSGTAITTSDTAIQGIAIPQKTEIKKLSLAEAIKIMKTTGASAETAELHRQSDIAVGNGYSETVSKIKETEDKLDLLSQYPDAAVEKKFGKGVVEMAYEAQVAGATSNNKEIMQIRRDFARQNTENNYQAELNQIESDTISIYYKVLLAQDNLKIAKENLASQQKTLKNVEAKKAVGLLSKKDVLQAKSSVSNAESSVRSAETQMKYAKMSFNYLLGYNVQQDVTFTDNLETITATTTTAAITADTAVQNALNHRIELKGANFAIKVYEILLDDLKAYPKNSSKYLNAKINLAESQKTAKDAYSKIEIDIRNKYDLVQDKKAAVDAAKELLTYATEGERLMQLTNEEGISTVEELLATQVSVYKAKLNLANANSEYALALKSYEFAQGVGTTRIPL
ncbi:MAG: TolC family protein [Aminipila sp.]